MGKVQRKLYIDEEKIELFDGLLALESEITGKTLSYLTETHIISAIAKTPESQRYATIMFYKSLDKSMSDVYSDLSNGIGFKAMYNNTRELFRFSKSLQCLMQPDSDLFEPMKKSILRQMEGLVDIIKYSKNQYFESYNKIDLEFEKNRIQSLEKYIIELKEWYSSDFTCFNSINIIDVILDGWDIFENHIAPYKILTIIHQSMPDYTYKSTDRWEYIQILNQMTSEWDK